MKSYLIKVVAHEFITVEAENEDRACEIACDRFGNNLEVDEAEIVESSVEASK